MTGIKSVTCKYKSVETTINVNKETSEIDDEIGILLLNNKYPRCELNANGELIVESLITTLGGNKSCKYLPNIQDIAELSELKNKKEFDLLKSTLVSAKDIPAGVEISSYVINTLTGTILTGLINDYPLSTGIMELNTTLSNISSNLEWNSQTWNIDFYSTYEEYLLSSTLPNINKSELTSILNKYNESLSGLTNILNFTPVINECLVEPLKIIFNFGTNLYVLNDFFDLDINVSISNDPIEKNKSVGWKCGYKQTKYLNWESGDNIHGGPEIVYVDIDTYKFYNSNKILDGTIKTLDLDINVCWFNESQIISDDVIINIVWKGYLYAIPVNITEYNIACCKNLVLTLKIDLTSNTISYNKIYYVGIITTYGSIETNDFNASLGYIKMPNDVYNKFVNEHNFENVIELDSINNKNYYLYSNIADTSANILKQELYKAWYLDFNKTKYNGKLLTNKEINLNWQEKIKLNINNKPIDYTLINYKQIIIYNEYVK